LLDEQAVTTRAAAATIAATRADFDVLCCMGPPARGAVPRTGDV
jgi:hypothetical protein